MKKQYYILLFFLSLLFSPSHFYAQNSFIARGKVISNTDREGLTGISVVIKGTTVGTITDIDGNFSIQIDSNYKALVFSMIGYEKKEIVVKDNEFIIVELLEKSELLDEVLVVGYGSQKKESITGAITSVSNKELIKSPVSNVSNALAGRLSGVSVVQRSGEPGRDQSDIRIRGISTLSASRSTPLIVVDGVERSSMDGIDMNEIESINVLKDASATAVYGIRGANGVILLTTKTGTNSKAIVNMSINVGVQVPTTLPDFLDSYEFALLKREGMINDGLEPVFSQEMLDKFKMGSDPVFFPTQNLYNRFFKKFAYREQYNVNISGGTEKAKYFVSLGYLNQDGLYDTKSIKKLNIGYDPNPQYSRFNIRNNFDFKITKELSATLKLGGQFTDSNYPSKSTETIFSNILGSPPMIGYGVYEGKLITDYLNDPLSTLAGRGLSIEEILLSNGYSGIISNTMNINVGLNYKLDKLVQGLSARVMYAYDNYYTKSETRNRTLDTYAAVKDVNGELVLVQNGYDSGFNTYSEGHSIYRIEYFESALDYQRTFGKNKISGLLLYNQRKRHTPGLDYSVPESLQGLVGRATYSFSDRYLTEFNLGYNGSENFAEGLRYGLFPAFSVGWIPTEEPFFPKNNYVNWIKLRASYGVVGNDKIGGDRFLYLPTTYLYGDNDTAGSAVYQFGTEGVDRENYSSAKEGKIGNPYVTWETAEKRNLGIDLWLFKNKLMIASDYFFENRDNILIERSTIPAIVGATDLPAVNLGQIENKGFEFEIKWNAKVNEFSYYIGGNVSHSKNTILFRDEAQAKYPWMMSTGFSVGQLKGYKTDGLYNYADEVGNRPYYSFYANKVQEGDIKYIDIDGDGIIDQNDIVPIGYSSYPQINFGVNVGFDWKGFDMSALLQGASQTTILQRSMTAWAFNLGYNMTLSEHMNRWNLERFDAGELITMPRISNNGSESPNSQNSDYWNQDASYMRLKNVELGYSIGEKSLRKFGVTLVRLYLNGNNLFTFTKLKNADPENPTTNTGTIYPQMRVYNIGLNIKY